MVVPVEISTTEITRWAGSVAVATVSRPAKAREILVNMAGID